MTSGGLDEDKANAQRGELRARKRNRTGILTKLHSIASSKKTVCISPLWFTNYLNTNYVYGCKLYILLKGGEGIIYHEPNMSTMAWEGGFRLSWMTMEEVRWAFVVNEQKSWANAFADMMVRISGRRRRVTAKWGNLCYRSQMLSLTFLAFWLVDAKSVRLKHSKGFTWYIRMLGQTKKLVVNG